MATNSIAAGDEVDQDPSNKYTSPPPPVAPNQSLATAMYNQLGFQQPGGQLPEGANTYNPFGSPDQQDGSQQPQQPYDPSNPYGQQQTGVQSSPYSPFGAPEQATGGEYQPPDPATASPYIASDGQDYSPYMVPTANGPAYVPDYQYQVNTAEHQPGWISPGSMPTSDPPTPAVASQPGPVITDPGMGGTPLPEGPVTPGPTQNDSRQNDLYNTLLGRAQQGLTVDPNDPNIKGQTDAFSAEQERTRRNFLGDLAEKNGPYSTGQQLGQARMTAEKAGQATGGFQAQLMGRELQSRRDEIAQALTSMGSMLSETQKVDLQRELATMDNSIARQNADTNTENSQALWDWIRSTGVNPQ